MSKPVTELKIRLRTALELRNMKPIELSEKTGIPKAAISQYMSGYSKPKDDRLYLICKALNVNEPWLLGYDVPMDSLYFDVRPEENPKKAPIENLMHYYTMLNSEGMKEALKRLEELTYIPKYTSVSESHSYLNAASDLPGASDEDKAHDNRIMDDDNF